MNKSFKDFQVNYSILPPRSHEEIKQSKIELVAGCVTADSIRDFGGLWGVNGLYLLEGAKALRCRYAEMVDVTPREEFELSAQQVESATKMKVVMTRADFRSPELYKTLSPVDVSILYEVLLHQDNSDEVIKNICSKTQKCICLAQPVLKEEMFILPNGCVNLQFYPEELKDRLRIPGWWPKEVVFERFDTRFWMWGQTTSYLQTLFYGNGWGLQHLETLEMSPYWNYALARFVPRNS